MSFSQKKRAELIANSYYKNWDIYGAKILDVGCGNGVVSKILKDNLNLKLYCTDIIDYRKIMLPFKKMREKIKLPFDDFSFDYVMFNDVLHHLEDIELLILEGKRVGKELLVFEDRENFLLNIADVVLNYFYFSKTLRPLNFKTKEEWCLLFDKLGLECESGKISYPFWYPFRHYIFKLRPKERAIKNF